MKGPQVWTVKGPQVRYLNPFTGEGVEPRNKEVSMKSATTLSRYRTRDGDLLWQIRKEGFNRSLLVDDETLIELKKQIIEAEGAMSNDREVEQ